MPKQLPIEIFMPPNMLKAKVGGGPTAVLDDNLVRRVETAVNALAGEFTVWLASDVARLVEARDRFAALCDSETRDQLFRASHDLKGGAETYEYPLIGRIGSSLCKLIDTLGTEAPLALIDAQVDAIRALFRDRVKHTNRVAVTLCEELEARVTEALERAR
jgi:hypothetical protein